MIEIRGFFKDIQDNDIEVIIQKQSDTTASYEINGDDGIYFAGESPVTITQEVENEFQHILSKQCTINLITDDYVGDLFFAENARDVTVMINKYITTGMLVRRYTQFVGFLEPVTFSQGFAHKYESFTLTASDYLGTLEYLNYKDITYNGYAEAKKNAKNVSFKEILLDMFQDLQIFYDQSKGIDSDANSLKTVFEDLGIFEVYFLGDTFDDLWTQKEILEELCKYLNLNAIQEANIIYLFDWDTVMQTGNSVGRWCNIRTGSTKPMQTEYVTLTKDDYKSDDTTVTVSDVYNQIQVTDDLKSIQTVIVSPLDSDSLRSFYRYKSDYMTEYQIDAVKDSTENWEYFEALISNGAVTQGNPKMYHWQIQPMYNVNWKLNIDSSTDVNSLVEFNESGKAINAYKLPLYAKQHALTPLILKAGSVEKRPMTDNEPVNNIDLDPYLVISILGNGVNPLEFNNLDPSPGPELLHSKAPLIEYESTQSGGTYSPVSSLDTNYLVFSGKLLLMPRVWECDRWVNCNSEVGSAIGNRFTCTTGRYGYETVFDEQDDYEHWYFMPVKANGEDSWRYYTRKFYKDTSTSVLSGYDDIRIDYSDNPEYDPNDPVNYPQYDFSQTFASLQMPVNNMDTSLSYDYSCVGNQQVNTVDKIAKLPILECELIIGDKRCVETNMDEYGNSSFIWVDASTGVEQTFIDSSNNSSTYMKKYISLGINPAIGDSIIGNEFELQNTVTYDLDLGDALGTAIPIRQEDNLSGPVSFKILGPINSTYNLITRRDPDFWHHTRWYENSKSVLSLCESIFIKEFEAKLYTTGQGSSEDLGDNDLVYISDEIDRYQSKADEVTFKFITQLSSEEAWNKKISPSVNQNAIINLKTKSPLSTIYNKLTNETAKAEEHYVDQKFRIFSKPRVVTQSTLDADTVNFEYMLQPAGQNTANYILSISKDMKKNTATVKMKQSDNQ